MLDKDLKIIQEIQKEAQEKYPDLLVKRKKEPELEQMMKNVVDGKHKDLISEEKRKEIESAFNLGYFSQEEEVADPLVAKKFDMYIRRRMIQEIRAGRLSNPKDDPDFDKLKDNTIDHVKKTYRKTTKQKRRKM